MARTIKVTPKVLLSFHPSKRAREDPSRDRLKGSKSFFCRIASPDHFLSRKSVEVQRPPSVSQHSWVCSGLRNIPQEANYIPSVSIAHVNLCVSHDPCDVTLIHNKVTFHWHFGHYVSPRTSQAISSSSLCFVTCQQDDALGSDLALNTVTCWVCLSEVNCLSETVYLRAQRDKRDIPSKSKMYSSRKMSEQTWGASLSSPAPPSLLTPGRSYIFTTITCQHKDDWNEIWLRLLLHLHSH